MKIYVFNHSGHYLGGSVVVAGGCLEDARSIAIETMVKSGVSENELDDFEVITANDENPTVVFFSSGDY